MYAGSEYPRSDRVAQPSLWTNEPLIPKIERVGGRWWVVMITVDERSPSSQGTTYRLARAGLGFAGDFFHTD
jgi:hypothetical protein